MAFSIYNIYIYFFFLCASIMPKFPLPIVMDQVVQSFDDLFHHGVALHGGESVKFAVCEIRGDWKWQQDI